MAENEIDFAIIFNSETGENDISFEKTMPSQISILINRVFGYGENSKRRKDLEFLKNENFIGNFIDGIKTWGSNFNEGLRLRISDAQILINRIRPVLNQMKTEGIINEFTLVSEKDESSDTVVIKTDVKINNINLKEYNITLKNNEIGMEFNFNSV